MRVIWDNIGVLWGLYRGYTGSYGILYGFPLGYIGVMKFACGRVLVAIASKHPKP